MLILEAGMMLLDNGRHLLDEVISKASNDGFADYLEGYAAGVARDGMRAARRLRKAARLAQDQAR